MLDIKFVRENPDAIDVAMANRQTSWDREKFFELDDERRAVITEVEELQATRNAESKKIGALMKEGKKDEAEAAKEAGNMVDLDNDPTKLIEIVEIGKQLLMTGAATTVYEGIAEV